LKIVEDKPVEAPIAESPIEPIAEPIADKAIESPKPEASGKKKSEKSGKKMKRLTLDIPKSLHKAIKGRAVEEGAPMADMLRSLLEQHYKTPS
jgi:predicted DNA binding CopG/RHH family protein